MIDYLPIYKTNGCTGLSIWCAWIKSDDDNLGFDNDYNNRNYDQSFSDSQRIFLEYSNKTNNIHANNFGKGSRLI